MGKIIAIANQKGGVGKTTTSVNLSACMAARGLRVLLIDMDPQSNASSGLGVVVGQKDKTIYHVLMQEASINHALVPTAVKNLFCVPANDHLAGAEVELVGVLARENILKNALQGEKLFDVIILDCPPSIGLLTLNSLVAAHSIIVPLQCEYYALEGLARLLQTVKMIKKSINKKLVFDGVVLTMFDKRNNLCHQVAKDAKKHLKNKVYNTVIPKNIRLSEAASHAKPIISYDKRSAGARAYVDLAKEIIASKKIISKKGREKIIIQNTEFA